MIAIDIVRKFLDSGQLHIANRVTLELELVCCVKNGAFIKRCLTGTSEPHIDVFSAVEQSLIDAKFNPIKLRRFRRSILVRQREDGLHAPGNLQNINAENGKRIQPHIQHFKAADADTKSRRPTDLNHFLAIDKDGCSERLHVDVDKVVLRLCDVGITGDGKHIQDRECQLF